MGKKSDIDYSPERVAQGLRDVVAWETRVPPEVEIATTLNGHTARVKLPLSSMGQKKRKQLERDLTDLLPEGYTLQLTWTE